MGNKQTAVEWLQEALEHTILTHEQIMQTIGLFEQAKQMEAEQPIAFAQWMHDYKGDINKVEELFEQFKKK
jgi:hypothetical protein